MLLRLVWTMMSKLKICGECRNLGADLPVYELTGTALRAHFKALQSALIDQAKAPMDQVDTLAERIIALLIENPSFTQDELAERTKVSIPTIKRTMKILSDNGMITRVGGKRYGHWQVNE